MTIRNVTTRQILRRKRVHLPLGKLPPGFRWWNAAQTKANWHLATGNATTNCWVRAKAGDNLVD